MTVCSSAFSSISEPKTFGWLRARARLPSGSLPGRIKATRQFDPALVMNPPKSAGRSPARTSEDLALPVAPEVEVALVELERPESGERVQRHFDFRGVDVVGDHPRAPLSFRSCERKA